jgi:endonuclease/exonuclease/phosphatase family metal-dependent hydrolase
MEFREADQLIFQLKKADKIFMKMILKFLLTTVLVFSVSYSQSNHKIMSYNLLNYPADSTTRNPAFRTILSNILPDVLVVQEMTSQAGVNGFLNNVLNSVSSGYSAGVFSDGEDTDNAVFYKNSLFTFISNFPVHTALRDINEFKLVHNATGDTLIIYSLHLKASSGGSNELLRAAEVDSLRKRTNLLPPGSNYIVVGDYNLYSSNEAAYQKLLNQADEGYFIDIFNLTGSWNQSQYAAYHTQSPRVRQFGGGSTGGMDDRFDLILMSQDILNEGGITYLPGSYTVYGNDGNHFNDSINRPPNTAVGQTIANALHNASDHLPIYANFNFASSSLHLNSFTALVEGLFNGTTMIPDTVTVELRNSSAPYSLVDQAKILLNNNGLGSANFTSASNNTPYYLVLKHRNALETWSASTLIFNSGLLTYDFTSASNKAFGSNQKFINGKWCIYSGDVNHDNFIDAEDLSRIFTDDVNGITGYRTTDLNGDMVIDINDVNKAFLNNISGFETKRPAGVVDKNIR